MIAPARVTEHDKAPTFNDMRNAERMAEYYARRAKKKPALIQIEKMKGMRR
ncbi:hypothetical protein [Phytohalomonas tamaricis]|uniref:hypothetical protein n=1 Tax=Phytohalomonas tamaricis TaxID=2081032 RepID=UPI00131A0271|nr:hypothetical protein [Phytohalomonas tamaricis]